MQLGVEWGYLFLSPRIANRIKAHRGDIHHVNSAHPISLLPRLRAILAGIIIQKNMAIANPTISANEFNMCSNMLMYLYHMKLCVVLVFMVLFLTFSIDVDRHASNPHDVQLLFISNTRS